MTQTVSKTVEELEKERDEWRELAIENSIRADKAQSLATAAAAHIVAGTPAKDSEPAPAPAPPPVPVAAPLPPRPASMSAFLAMPPGEQKRVAAAYGGRDALEETLDAEFHRANMLGNARRGGSSSHRIATFGENAPLSVAEAQERARAEVAAYQAGAPRPIPHGTFDPVKANTDALNRGLGWGAPKPQKPAAPVSAPQPAPGQKVRHLGGFGIRK